MPIKKITQVTAFYEDDGPDGLAYIIENDDGTIVSRSFIDGEPEDYSLACNFSDAYDFLDIMKEIAISENVVFEEKDFGTDWDAFVDAIYNP